MSQKERMKLRDEGIRQLNAVGLSQSLIARKYRCTPTTVSLRLKHMGIESVDGRKAFMDEVFPKIPLSVREFIGSQVNSGKTIQQVVIEALETSYERHLKE